MATGFPKCRGLVRLTCSYYFFWQKLICPELGKIYKFEFKNIFLYIAILSQNGCQLEAKSVIQVQKRT